MKAPTWLDHISGILGNLWMAISRHFMTCRSPNQCYGICWPDIPPFKQSTEEGKIIYTLPVSNLEDQETAQIYLYYCPFCGRKIKAQLDG